MSCRGIGLSKAASLAALVLAAAGCASSSPGDSMWWRSGVVLRAMPQSQIPPNLDSECVVAPTTTAAPDASVAVVSFRAGRSPYSKALVVADGDTLKAGDHVFVEPGACKIRVDKSPGESRR
jgi:hypothetical protein